MLLSRKNDINNKVLQQVDKFKYLRTMVTSDGKLARSKSAFQKMKSIFTNSKLTFKVRRTILQCYIEAIVLPWTINQQVQKTYICFLRRMLTIPWTATKTNEEVFNEAGEATKLLITTRRCQVKFFEYVMRRKQQGSSMEKTCRGR